MKNRILIILGLMLGALCMWATQPVGQAKQPPKRAMWKAAKQQIRQMESATFLVDSIRCDWMELSNGSRFQVQVFKMNTDSVHYRLCRDGQGVPERVVAMSDVKSLRSENGEAYYESQSTILDERGRVTPKLHRNNRKWAAWSLGLGIFAFLGSFIPIFGWAVGILAAIASLILGYKSRRDSKAKGAQPNSMAIAGIVLGYVYFISLIMVFLFILLLLAIIL